MSIKREQLLSCMTRVVDSVGLEGGCTRFDFITILIAYSMVFGRK